MSTESYELSKLDTKDTARLYLHPQYWVVCCDRPRNTRYRATTEVQLHESGTKVDLVYGIVENGLPVGIRGAVYLAALPETFALCRERWAESSIWDLIDDIEKRVDLLEPTPCNCLRLTRVAKDGSGDLDWFAENNGRNIRLCQFAV